MRHVGAWTSCIAGDHTGVCPPVSSGPRVPSTTTTHAHTYLHTHNIFIHTENTYGQENRFTTTLASVEFFVLCQTPIPEWWWCVSGSSENMLVRILPSSALSGAGNECARFPTSRESWFRRVTVCSRLSSRDNPPLEFVALWL